MGLEAVHGVVRGAHDEHAVLPKQALRREIALGQETITTIVDLSSRVGAEQHVPDSERKPKLEVSPMVERISECVRNRARPSFELFPVEALPLMARSGTPFVRIARHL